MLEHAHDPETLRMRHEAYAHEERMFWDSLNATQTRFILGIVTQIMKTDDPTAAAGMIFGQAEMALMLKHGTCGCGETHDADSFLKELHEKSKLIEAEKSDLDEYRLMRMNPDGFACQNCGALYASVEERKKAGCRGFTGCPGCNPK